MILTNGAAAGPEEFRSSFICRGLAASVDLGARCYWCFWYPGTHRLMLCVAFKPHGLDLVHEDFFSLVTLNHSKMGKIMGVAYGTRLTWDVKDWRDQHRWARGDKKVQSVRADFKE